MIDPASIEQVGHVADLLHVNSNRVHEALKAGNNTGGTIRKWIDDSRASAPKQRRWKRSKR